MKNKINLLLTAIFLTVILIGCGKENPMTNNNDETSLICGVDLMKFDCDSLVFVKSKEDIYLYRNNKIDTIKLLDYINISVKIK